MQRAFLIAIGFSFSFFFRFSTTGKTWGQMIIRNDLNLWSLNHFPLPRPLPIYRTASQWNCQTQVRLLQRRGHTKFDAIICQNRTDQFLCTGSNGFLLPANQIETVGRELWAATSVVGHQYSIHPQLMFYTIDVLHNWNSLSNISSLPKRQPATTWDPIQLLQRTLHLIMNSRTKVAYVNTTEKVWFLSRGMVQKKLTKNCVKSDHIEQILIIPSWNKTIRKD